MSEGGQIRVILRWIEIKDAKEGPGDDEGEFTFSATVTSGADTQESAWPRSGTPIRISDKPHNNRVSKIDWVLYEGAAGESLSVTLNGLEHDLLSANDPLAEYNRVFDGPSDSWIGRHQPSDEGGDDPENMVDWRVCYDIETV